jgi:hypothetical protein
MYTGISNSDGTFTYEYHLVTIGFTFVRLSDFTGDGKADLFLYRAIDGLGNRYVQFPVFVLSALPSPFRLAFLVIGDGTGGFTFNPLFISAGYHLYSHAVQPRIHFGSARRLHGRWKGGCRYLQQEHRGGVFRHQQDVNGDGKIDVVLYNSATGTEYTGISNANGTFAYTYQYWGNREDAGKIEP